MTETKTASTENLKEVVAKFRLQAREQLRTERVSKIMGDMGYVQIDLNEINIAITHAELMLKVAEYEKTKLDAAHPLIESLTKDINELIDYRQKEIKRLNESRENTEKKIAEMDKKIEETQDGTWKCGMDQLNEMTNEMLDALK